MGNVRLMRKRGVTTTNVLIFSAVILVAGALLYFINRSILLNNDESEDIRKMRRIVVAIDLYESENNELPPLSLEQTQLDVGDESTYLAANDPFRIGTQFPLDPAFPNSSAKSVFRVSFTYLPQWIENGKLKPRDWKSVYEDSHIGLLACYWYGNTSHVRTDGLDSTGPIIRINMDGSAKVIPFQRKSKGFLDSLDLFNIK